MRKISLVRIIAVGALVSVLASAGNLYADNVTRSRHNMSRLTSTDTVLWQEQAGFPVGTPYGINMTGAGGGTYINQYGEVCVYCHTPHGAATVAPLWNRAVNSSGNYTPYSSSTMDNAPGQPIGVSLACLSCHDGTIAVDSIINAPGSGLTWGGATAGSHLKMNGAECGACHNGAVGHNGAVKYLGTDLSTQHPISMLYPTLTGNDPMFNAPDVYGKFANGVKLYNGRVECPSCHNPHLGEGDYATSPALRPFLRVSNANSYLCTTCHIK